MRPASESLESNVSRPTSSSSWIGDAFLLESKGLAGGESKEASDGMVGLIEVMLDELF